MEAPADGLARLCVGKVVYEIHLCPAADAPAVQHRRSERGCVGEPIGTQNPHRYEVDSRHGEVKEQRGGGFALERPLVDKVR